MVCVDKTDHSFTPFWSDGVKAARLSLRLQNLAAIRSRLKHFPATKMPDFVAAFRRR
ncbi:hypothetical protein Ga0080574_TMP3172 [Salipiger abyssi]|uniref:Uncharacterized protein n=1 Tax=Salipiger abyssi TaxID=1250539 RepID=A0A1P8UVY1_9RHOB|nr:hypothetical protein Ga0080574_TMP3172 [Salipiger abyssi]